MLIKLHQMPPLEFGSGGWKWRGPSRCPDLELLRRPAHVSHQICVCCEKIQVYLKNQTTSRLQYVTCRLVCKDETFLIFQTFRVPGSFLSSLKPPTVSLRPRKDQRHNVHSIKGLFICEFLSLRTLLVRAHITGAHQSVWIFI